MRQSPPDRIVACLNRIYRSGLTTSSGGNLSIREPDGTVWITPSGVDKGMLTAEDLVRIGPDGGIHGRYRPSIEAPFHRAIYAARPEVAAILHAHPPTLIGFSIAGRVPESRISPETYRTCGPVAATAYAVQGSPLLGERLAAALTPEHHCAMLENHGIVTVGADMAEAFGRFECLDAAAGSVFYAELAGGLAETPVELPGTEITYTPPGFFPADPGLADERARLAFFSFRAGCQKLFTATRGTVALRVPGGFLISPAAGDRLALDPLSVVLCRDGAIEAGKAVSRDYELVAAVFAAQPEVNALFVAAPPRIMGYAIARTRFDSRAIPESFVVLRETPAFAFGDRPAAAAALSLRRPAAVIAFDAVAAAGKDLVSAFDRLEVLELSAGATLIAATLGGARIMDEARLAELMTVMKLEP